MGNLLSPPKEGTGLTHKYESGDVYVGDFKDGQRHGYGIYTSVQGHRYEGEWFADQRHGIGTLTFATKSSDGKGEPKWAGTYQGEWHQNLKQGKGVFKYQNGDVYEGSWSKGMKHGAGIYTYSSGDRYEGMFKDNLLHGKGTLISANGDRLEGVWLNDEIHGDAILTTASGQCYKEVYEKGERTSSRQLDGKEIEQLREHDIGGKNEPGSSSSSSSRPIGAISAVDDLVSESRDNLKKRGKAPDDAGMEMVDLRPSNEPSATSATNPPEQSASSADSAV